MTDTDHELAAKVDALLHRHTPAQADERNIPLLSEIVHAPQWQPEPGNVAARELPFGEEREKLARDVFQRVFHKIEGELAQRIESRLIESLAEHIGPVLNHVMSDMRQDIANLISQAINEALKDALDRSTGK
jgi:hypothetical protein